MMQSWLERARTASNLEPESCASCLSRSVQEYEQLELHPGRLTLNQLNALCSLFNDASLEIVSIALDDLTR